MSHGAKLNIKQYSENDSRITIILPYQSFSLSTRPISTYYPELSNIITGYIPQFLTTTVYSHYSGDIFKSCDIDGSNFYLYLKKSYLILKF